MIISLKVKLKAPKREDETLVQKKCSQVKVDRRIKALLPGAMFYGICLAMALQRTGVGRC